VGALLFGILLFEDKVAWNMNELAREVGSSTDNRALHFLSLLKQGVESLTKPYYFTYVAADRAKQS
jgi:hypothetical protein